MRNMRSLLMQLTVAVFGVYIMNPDSEGMAMLQDKEYEVTIDAVRCIMGQFRGGLSKLNLKSK